MSRVAYVNGRYEPHRTASVHIEDRGYQFADGVYEVIAVMGGVLLDLGPHLARLARSLGELQIARPMTDAALTAVMHEVVRRNGVAEGILYLQVTRGIARRDHAFPGPVRPSVVMTARAQSLDSSERARKGVAVVTMPDLRWARRDIKSIGLLPNAMAKQAARQAGAYEAWLIDADGNVTEGSSTNAWIVSSGGELVTRHLDHGILSGVTRLGLVELARKAGLTVVQRPFTPAEALAGREAFLTSTTSFVLPIVSIDGKPVGGGVPGPVAQQLRTVFLAHASEQVQHGALVNRAGRS
jgi:D-alanine transaminase